MTAPRITRRGFVAGALTAPWLLRSGILCARWPAADPFTLGVAAGDPTSDGFALWTRLAPDPLSADPEAPGGLSRGDVAVGYEIASDEAFSNVVQRGSATAEAAFAHSVHLEVSGLSPGRPYWYRFMSGDATSPIGRAITVPKAGSSPERLRFACASCSHYEVGWFSAYRHMAAENPELVLFLGDYIYEYLETRRPTVRKHSDGVEAATLPTYRNRYAQYRTDPDLQRLHATATALTTWDDHEVQNDYAGQWGPTFDDPAKFLERRTAAYRAFWEHMPLRPSRGRPDGQSLRVYDRTTFGDLVQFHLLDGRQYRSREACDTPSHRGGHVETDAACPERREAKRTMLGAEQEAWLAAGLSGSKARWNVLAQDVMMAQLRERDGDTIGYWVDDWNGYPANRDRLLKHIRARKVKNPVVLGGDIHSFWANDLLADFDDPRAPVIASELITSSITSYPPPYEKFAGYLADNPHVRFFESRSRGYLSLELTPQQLTARCQVISDPQDPKATLSTLATFTIADGKPGPVRS